MLELRLTFRFILIFHQLNCKFFSLLSKNPGQAIQILKLKELCLQRVASKCALSVSFQLAKVKERGDTHKEKLGSPSTQVILTTSHGTKTRLESQGEDK